MITSNHTKANFGWKLMPHPPYSADLSPSDYHLLGSLTNHIKGTYEENLHEFFDQYHVKNVQNNRKSGEILIIISDFSRNY